MTSVDDTVNEPLKVTFFPPLSLQRRSWVLNILRREDVTSVSVLYSYFLIYVIIANKRQ